jgi:ketosteroid isomerase-like protein
MKLNRKLFTPLLAVLAVMVIACADETQTGPAVETTLEPVVSPDSLVQAWNRAWNEKDTAAIAKSFSENSVVLSGDWMQKGKDSIMQKWVHENLPVSSNLRTTHIADGTSVEMALYSGFYTIDVAPEGCEPFTEVGNFTAIWKKYEDRTWKLDMFDVEEIEEKEQD